MKAVETATLTVHELDDGRRRFSIRHEIVEGVTPKMIVWWLNNMEGDMDLFGQRVPRYRAWHPRDHVRLTYVRPARDGSRMGPGSRMRIEELFGADPRNEVDITDEVERLDEEGFVHVGRVLGREVVRMEYTFTETDRGTLYENSLTIGVTRGPARGFLNSHVVHRLFPREKGEAWQKHNVEEVGNWQFFLPGLYRGETGP